MSSTPHLKSVPPGAFRFIANDTTNFSAGSEYMIYQGESSEHHIVELGRHTTTSYIFLSPTYPQYLFHQIISVITRKDGSTETKTSLAYRNIPNNFTEDNLNDGTPENIFNKGLSGLASDGGGRTRRYRGNRRSRRRRSLRK
jgi:hypothetical protein